MSLRFDRKMPGADSLAAPRLGFLDGIRGLTALFVVLHHAYMEVFWARGADGRPHGAFAHLNFLAYGHFAVDVFIVLSGFCLMLPVACSTDGKLRGGTLAFLRRRARRILPPYYAALGLSLLLIATVPFLHRPTGGQWDHALPAMTRDVLLSHALLYHNLFPEWIFKINPPMWSVATEWQIYYFMPLVLLPVWRRWGMKASLPVAVALGMVPSSLSAAFNDACFWYLGLFATGMAAAAACASTRPMTAFIRNTIPWGSLSFGLACVVVTMIYLPGGWWGGHVWLVDPVIGLAAASLILHCNTGHSLVRGVFESRWAVGLGAFSYSLYLIHSPLLAIAHYAVALALPAPGLALAAMLLLATPLAVLAAYLFYRAFEQPFLAQSSSRRSLAAGAEYKVQAA